MSFQETTGQSSPDIFQGIIYKSHESEVLLLQKSESGLYELPQSLDDPSLDKATFKRDIRDATGFTVAPFMETFDDSTFRHNAETTERMGIVVHHTTHYVLSRVVEGDLSLSSRYATSEWSRIADLPESDLIEPSSLVGLQRFQIAWALANAS
jgi:hypothetical protein